MAAISEARVSGSSYTVVRTCRLALQYTKKRASIAKCGDCGCKLRGITCLRPKANINVAKRSKHVTRAYGGARCGNCVRQRIIRYARH
jgi:ribosomal protein L34E